MPEEINIALFIDADNSPAKSAQKIFSELARYGKVNIRRAYGNWRSDNLKSWGEVLHEHAIQPIQQYDLTKGKNATDMAMTIAIMDILYTKHVDTFCIVTSDCDFTPLATRIREEGKRVIGFGRRKTTPPPFVNACSNFLYLEDDPPEETGSSEKKNPTAETKITGPQLRQDTKLMNLIREAIAAGSDDEGWTNLSAVGTHISNHASFDSRNYGYAKLSALIEAIGMFELRSKGKVREVKDARKK